MQARKGISPILATVIIIAVTLVIAVGVIGWIMGLWGSFGATEALKITPLTYNASNGNLELYITNEGTAPAKIIKIEVVGIGSNSTAVNPETLQPGAHEKVTTTISGSGAQAGIRYQVKVYTSSGNVYTTFVTAS